MGGVLKFFLNALKALFLSPFYLVAFAFYLIICVFNYLIGEIRVVFSGFKYGSIKENIYQKRLMKIKAMKGEKQ